MPFHFRKNSARDKIIELDKKSGVLAIGFLALPYPSYRLPGWQRASIGIHSDDGRRYVNDTFGGRDLTTPFSAGEVIGVGMEFDLGESRKHSDSKIGSVQPYSNVRCFMTRNGHRKPDWEWDLHEEVDADEERPGGVRGLEGDRDLYATVGVYGKVVAEVRFSRENHLWTQYH